MGRAPGETAWCIWWDGDPLRELRAFNTSQVWLTLLIGAVGFAGMFCAFSYLAPTLTEVTGTGDGWIPIAMGVFGVGSIIGNLAGGWLVDRLQFRAAPVILAWSALVLLAYPFAAHSLWTMLPAVVAVGTMGALAPVLQTRLMDVAGEAQTFTFRPTVGGSGPRCPVLGRRRPAGRTAASVPSRRRVR